MVHLEPIAKWCEADYIEKRVHKIDANSNTLIFEDGGSIKYDVLGVNVGSRTRGAETVPGVWTNSLTTRPINDLLGKIEAKEQYLLKNKITPSIAVCGSGAAGIELAFGFKNRWSKLFGTDVRCQLICSDSDIMRQEAESVRELTKLKFREHGIEIVANARILSVGPDGVSL
jgi:NADH dehydrogenase FAD-containing subunit